MKNKYNNTVILSQGGEHGKRVIQWWKEQGVDTIGCEGFLFGWYYGVINGKFSMFYECPSNAKIIELPESKPQDLIGRKVRGFKFEGTEKLGWWNCQEDYIGKVGEILAISSPNDSVLVKFNDRWACQYPLSLIHDHLVEDETNVETSKIIDLSNVEGVEMMVSQNDKDYVKRNVVAKCNARHIDSYGDWWLFAKPIEQVKKITMEDIEKMFGGRVEIVKEVSNEQ